MDWASGADRHQKTPLKKIRAFFLEGGGERARARARQRAQRAAHARSAALVAISNRRGGGGEDWAGGICGQKLDFLDFFEIQSFFRFPTSISWIHTGRVEPSPLE